MVENISADAEDMGLQRILGLGRFHMLQGNLAHESQLLKPVSLELCSATRESPHTTAR